MHCTQSKEISLHAVSKSKQDLSYLKILWLMVTLASWRPLLPRLPLQSWLLGHQLLCLWVLDCTQEQHDGSVDLLLGQVLVPLDIVDILMTAYSLHDVEAL